MVWALKRWAQDTALYKTIGLGLWASDGLGVENVGTGYTTLQNYLHGGTFIYSAMGLHKQRSMDLLQELTQDDRAEHNYI